MNSILAYTLILALLGACFAAAGYMIWDLWHIPVIYVDGAE